MEIQEQAPDNSTAPDVAPENGEVIEETIQETSTTPESEEKMYELPDGKQVTADVLSKKWKEDFLPEFTRRSQRLSSLEKKDDIKPEIIGKPWEDPNWEPKTYQELLEASHASVEDRIFARLADEKGAKEKEIQQQEIYIQQEMEQIKELDPKVDVNTVIAHASRFAFKSLLPAYQNMKVMEEVQKRAVESFKQNMQIKANDPVGNNPSLVNGEITLPAELENASGYEKAQWFMNNKK